MTTNKEQHIESFRQLHKQKETFILPNAWDAISAIMFEQAGFKALGTTSAGIATSLGYKDGENIPFPEMLSAVERITRAVNIPVSVDLEAGYGETEAEIKEVIQQIISTGAVGINLEDGTGNPNKPLHNLSEQVNKIKLIKTITADQSLFINARTDTYWLSIGSETERYEETIKRAQAFTEAGADCIFIPGLSDQATIEAVRKEISLPINLLATPTTPSLEELTEIGIERVSTGSAPFRASVTLMKSIATDLKEKQSFTSIMDGVMPYG